MVTANERQLGNMVRKALLAPSLDEMAVAFDEWVKEYAGAEHFARVIVPNPEGGIRVLPDLTQDFLPDATGALLWLNTQAAMVRLSKLNPDNPEQTAAAELCRSLASKTLLPLRHRGLLLGLLATSCDVISRDEELAWRTISGLAGSLLANFLLSAETTGGAQVRESLELATALHTALLPAEKPVFASHYSVSGLSRSAAQCGGDFWCWREIGSGKVFLMIGDATGHGLAPSLVVAAARGAFDTYCQLAGPEASPGELLSSVNTAAFRAGRRQYTMTAFAALCDPLAQTLVCANAGQNFPYMLSQKGCQPVVIRGNSLGLSVEAQYTNHLRPMAPGDTLVLFTDGIVEAGLPMIEPFGEKRFRSALSSVPAKAAVNIPRIIFDSVTTYLNGMSNSDDMTLLSFQLGTREERL